MRRADHPSSGVLQSVPCLNCDREASIRKRPWTTRGLLRHRKRSHLHIKVEVNESGTYKYTYRMEQNEGGDFQLHYLIHKNSCKCELTLKKQDLKCLSL